MLEKQPHIIVTQEFISQWGEVDKNIVAIFIKTIREVLAGYEARI